MRNSIYQPHFQENLSKSVPLHPYFKLWHFFKLTTVDLWDKHKKAFKLRKYIIAEFCWEYKVGKELSSFDHDVHERTVNLAYFKRSNLIKKLITLLKIKICICTIPFFKGPFWFISSSFPFFPYHICMRFFCEG